MKHTIIHTVRESLKNSEIKSRIEYWTKQGYSYEMLLIWKDYDFPSNRQGKELFNGLTFLQRYSAL